LDRMDPFSLDVSPADGREGQEECSFGKSKS